MARKKSVTTAEKTLTATEERIKAIREIPEERRSEAIKDELKQLLADERRERFVRHAERRTGNAIKAIGNVGRLGNRASYQYTEEEAAAIVEALATALAKARGSFGEKKTADGFRLFGS